MEPVANEIVPTAPIPPTGAGEVVAPGDPSHSGAPDAAPAGGEVQPAVVPVQDAGVAPEVDGGEATADASSAATTVLVGHDGKPHRQYPSLYDSTGTTIVAIFFGICIIGGIQAFVARIFKGAKDEYAALTHFVVAMVALVIGAYLVDLIISGPDTSLLTGAEKATILDFIKHTCGLVFGYYFGSRSRSTTTVSSDTPSE